MSSTVRGLQQSTDNEPNITRGIRPGSTITGFDQMITVFRRYFLDQPMIQNDLSPQQAPVHAPFL